MAICILLRLSMVFVRTIGAEGLNRRCVSLEALDVLLQLRNGSHLDLSTPFQHQKMGSNDSGSTRLLLPTLSEDNTNRWSNWIHV